MKFTIKYKNGFIKTIFIDGLYVYDDKLIYRTEGKQLEVELAYVEGFRAEWNKEDWKWIRKHI